MVDMIIALRHNKAVKAELRIFNILSQLCGGCDSNGLTDLLQKQNSAKESEGFNAQSYNYGANNSVAHVIAHRSITAGLDTSYVYENNNLYSGGNSNGSFKNGSIGTGLLADYYNDWDSADVFRLGIYRDSWQNNGMVRLSESADEQNQLNNDENRVLIVVDIRGSETLQDWICNAERIYPDRVLISKFVLMLFYFVIKHKQ